jgi:hypothetical protein
VVGRRRDGGGLHLPLPLLAAPNHPPATAPPCAAPPGQRRRDCRPVQLRQVSSSSHGKIRAYVYTLFGNKFFVMLMVPTWQHACKY